MQTNTQIKELEDKFQSFTNNLNQFKGEYSYLLNETQKNKDSISKLEHTIDITNKAVELLNLVQKVTRDRIKEQFESLVSWALNYVFQRPYKFVLVFSTRGNLQELKFAIKSPDCNEEIDPLTSRGGGVLDIISLSLRLILMEIGKVNGFIIFDEGLEKVKGEENIARLNDFITQINKNFKRQIINITDAPNFKNNLGYNLIEIK